MTYWSQLVRIIPYRNPRPGKVSFGLVQAAIIWNQSSWGTRGDFKSSGSEPLQASGLTSRLVGRLGLQSLADGLPRLGGIFYQYIGKSCHADFSIADQLLIVLHYYSTAPYAT